MGTPLRVLIFTNREADARLIEQELCQAGFDPESRHVATEAEYVEHLRPSLDVVLSDYLLPQVDALRALRIMQERNLDIPFILVTGSLGDELAVECVKRGAADYVLKESLGRLGLAVTNTLEQKRLRTERALAEVAFKEANDLYRAVVENARDAIVITMGSERVYVNKAFVELHGLAHTGEALAMPLAETAVPEDRDMVVERALARQRGEPLPDIFQYRLRRQDGEVRTIEVSGVNIVYKGKGAALAILRDVTDLNRAEEKASDAQEFARSLIDSSLDMIIAVDPDRRIVEFNRAAQQVFGYSLDEVLGKSVDMLYADPAVGRRVHEIVAGTGRHVGEIINVRKNGQTFPCLLSASILHNSKAEMIGVMGISRDVTEMKLAEQSLRENEELYRTLFDNAPLGISIVDLEGNMIAHNNAMLEPGGYTQDDAATFRSLSNLYHDPKERTQALAIARGQGFLHRHHVSLKGKDGTPYDALLTLSPITYKSRSCWQAVVEDITERVAAEAQKEHQLQELTALNRLFQDHLSQRFTVVEAYRELLDELEANPENLATILQRARSAPLPDLEDIPGIGGSEDGNVTGE